MTPEELEEIKQKEFRRGQDRGRVETIEHLSHVISLPTTTDIIIFDEIHLAEKYKRIRNSLIGQKP